MKKFLFDELKSLVQVRNSSTNCKNIEILSNTKHLNTIESSPASFTNGGTKKKSFCNSFKHLTKKYSCFSKEYSNYPIKFKVRTDICGAKVAEPYITTKPSPITIPPLSMDFTMNPEECCSKLQGQIVTTSPPCIYSIPQKCSKTKFPNPTALTKYLKCQEVPKGVETNDCNEKNHCDSIKTQTYTGKDYDLKDLRRTKTSYVTKPQMKQKTKKVLETLISKLTTKKPSGVSNENHVREVCNKLRTETDLKEFMTCVKDTSDREKSPEIKFGAQNLRERYSLLKEFDANGSCEALEAFLIERSKLLEFLKNEETDLRSSQGGMSRAVKSTKIEDVIEKGPGAEDKVKPKNPRRKVQRKQKNITAIRRRRRRPRWFSRIPIEPNMKGSVIFASGTAQELEDPCKILSVNFSDSNLHPMKERIEVNPDGNRCKSAVQHMMDNYDYVLRKTTQGSLNNKSEYSDDKSKIDSSKVYGNSYRQKDPNTECTNTHKETQETEEFIQRRLEPTIRQKKISKLDKTTFSERQPQLKKRQTRMKKPFDLKHGSTDNFNNPLVVANSASEAFVKGYHAFTTNNLLINFKKGEICVEKIRKDVAEAKSDISFAKIKEISPTFENGDEEESLRSRSSFSQNILPGMPRPVTQKAAHLNFFLESNVKTPASKAWKTNSDYLGKIKDESGKKKAMSMRNKSDTMEMKGVNYQQYRMKSTDKSVASSRCDFERRPCHHRKNVKEDDQFPLDWDYEDRLPDKIARKWNTLECSEAKDTACPITNEDLKKGIPNRIPTTAAAINRCNFEECKDRLRRRSPITRCRIAGSTKRPGK